MIARSLGRWAALLVLLVAAASRADVPTAGAAAPPADSAAANATEAQRYYQEGMKHYDLGEFDAAVGLFKKAYDLTSAAPLLFNLGQAARKKHDYESAKNFYQAYLRRSPDAENRADVEKFIQEVDEQLAHPASPAVAVPVAAGGLPVAPAEHEPAPSRESDAGPGGIKLPAGLAIAGAGLALVATGLYCGVRSNDDAGQLADLAVHHGMWSAQYQAVASDGESAATAATVLLILGGATVAVGGVLAVLGVRERNLARRVAVAPIAGGALLTISGAVF